MKDFHPKLMISQGGKELTERRIAQIMKEIQEAIYEKYKDMSLDELLEAN